jgi:peptide/nickel transport system substrate-binding protein
MQEGSTKASNAKRPIGTGAFKYESFTPGSRSVFVKNENYWEEGKPYVDRLVVDSSFTDNNALLNAMLSGQIDLIAAPALSQVQQQAAAGQVQILRTPAPAQAMLFGMRVDKGPFADNRIRQAFKLLTDRQALINGAYAGIGEPAADIVGPYTPYYASDLKAEYDPEKAKSLFKAAGVLGNTFELPIANALAGMIESATVWKEQVKPAGVTLKLKTLPSGIYWTPAGKVNIRPMSENTSQPMVALGTQYRAFFETTAPFQDTHWGQQPNGGKAKNNLILEAQGTLDEAKAKELWHEVQLQQLNEGGYVAWGNVPYLDFAAKNVRGLKANNAFALGHFQFADAWLA